MKPPAPEATAAKLWRMSRLRPRLAIVLGTGFDHLVRDVQEEVRITYERLPGFAPVGTVGHRGELVIGRLGGEPVIVLAGRAHYYEGHPISAVTFGVRVLAAYGVRDLLLTNAAGGINPKFRVGDFMVLEDHINLMGTNPLLGTPLPGLPRFVDLSCTYEPSLRRLLQRAARECGAPLRPGVYVAVCGPCYETPAEIRAFRTLGADAVGMSTVPEAIVARQCGLRVAAISCITNLAAGRGKTPLSHREVLQTASSAQATAQKVLNRFVTLYARAGETNLVGRGSDGP